MGESGIMHYCSLAAMQTHTLKDAHNLNRLTAKPVALYGKNLTYHYFDTLHNTHIHTQRIRHTEHFKQTNTHTSTLNQ